MQNKKGATLGGWVEVILIGTLVVMMLAIVGSIINQQYGTNDDYTLGIAANNTLADFTSLQGSFTTATDDGQITTGSAYGLTWTSTWGLMKATTSLIWGFIAGNQNWINIVVNTMHLPAAFAVILRVLFFIGVGFILIRIFMKVDP